MVNLGRSGAAVKEHCDWLMLRRMACALRWRLEALVSTPRLATTPFLLQSHFSPRLLRVADCSELREMARKHCVALLAFSLLVAGAAGRLTGVDRAPLQSRIAVRDDCYSTCLPWQLQS